MNLYLELSIFKYFKAVCAFIRSKKTNRNTDEKYTEIYIAEISVCMYAHFNNSIIRSKIVFKKLLKLWYIPYNRNWYRHCQ